MKRSSTYWLVGGLIAAVAAVAIVLIVVQNKNGLKMTDNKLAAWELPVVDVPGVLPGEIRSFAEDKSGVIWIGTDNGLIRCDPKKEDWRIFTKKDGLAGDFIGSIHQARDGKIWFGTSGDNFTYYDPVKKAFNSIPTLTSILFEDTSGGLWFYGLISDLFYLPPGGKELILQKIDTETIGSIDQMLQDKRGRIWAMRLKIFDKIESHIQRFNPEQKKWLKIPLDGIKSIYTMAEDRAGNIWFGGAGGVGYYSIDEDKWNYIQDSAGKTVKIIYPDSRGNTWLIGEGEVTLFDCQEKKIKPWRKIPNKERGPIYIIVEEDRQGRIWIASNYNIYISDTNFDRLEKMDPGIKEVQGEIDSIIMGENHEVWFEMDDSVLGYVPDSSPEWQFYKYKDGLPSSFPFNKRFKMAGQNWALFENTLFSRGDLKQDLWKRIDYKYLKGDRISSWSMFHNGELIWINNKMINLKTGYWINIFDRNKRGIPNDTKKILAFLKTSKGTELISFEDGLYCRDCVTKKMKKFSIIDIASVGSVHSIEESADGTVWFGAQKAVCRYNPNTKQIETFLLPKNITGPITTLHEDRSGMLWIASGSGLFKYSYQNKKWETDNRLKEIKNIESIHEDNIGILWFYKSEGFISTMYRYNPQANQLKTLEEKMWNGKEIAFPDSFDGKWIWIISSNAVSRQVWNKEGIPSNLETYLTNKNKKCLARISFIGNNQSFVIWRTRFTVLLKSTTAIAIPYVPDIGFPIKILEKAPEGGVWVGYTMGGLELRNNNGKIKRFETKDGLPNMTILDISQVPGANEPLAWVGTNDGAALVDKGKIRVPVQSKKDPGPVDVVLAMPDGSAYFAFNSIPSELFLDPPDSPVQLPRQDTYIKHVKANGEMETAKIEVPRGDVLDMALGADEETIWVGTTAGLYRLRNNTSEKITANGRLQPSPVRVIAVDPRGTVWMGIDGTKDDRFDFLGEDEILIPATVVGYSPTQNDIRTFTTDNGLPEASGIDMLDFTPDGRLAVMADGKLVSGKVFVPGSPLKYWLIGFCIIFISGLFFIARIKYQHKKEMESRYTPLIESAREFFAALDKQVKQSDYRTLTMPAANGGVIPIRCAHGDMLPVEAILSAYKTLPKHNGNPCPESYLVFSNALDPAASRQLDVYRLRHQTVIVPLSVAFIRAKLADGPAAVRAAWDGLLRRYLGKQDLFDMRNALDEARFFFGRKSLIDDLFYALNRREHVALTGPRKAGKSSLLNLLYQRLNAYPVIMMDLQIYNRSDRLWPQLLFKEIISRYDRWGVARYGGKWNPPSLIEETAMISGPVFRAALETRRDLQKSLKSDQPLVIMLDEIERLFPQSEAEHGDPAQLQQQAQRFNLFAGILRALGQEGGDRLISMVIADRQPLFNRVNGFKIPGIDTNPFYRFFQEFYLKPLEPPECREMISEIGHAMGLEVEEDVLSAIYNDSGGFPALARQVASAAANKRGENVKIDSAHYHQGITWLQEERGDIDRFFKENFRDVMNNAERRILALAANENGVPVETLETAAVPQERERIIEARRDMLAVGILEKINTNYRVSGALFRQWIKENRMMNDEC